MDPTSAAQAVPAAPQAVGDILQYVQAGGPLALLAAFIYAWTQYIAPSIKGFADAIRAEFKEARIEAEGRAHEDRETFSRVTREGMVAVGAAQAAALADSLNRAGERAAGELRRIDDHLTALASGAGCAAGADCPAPVSSRPASQPPGFALPIRPRRGGTVPPQASPFAAVAMEGARE